MSLHSLPLTKIWSIGTINHPCDDGFILLVYSFETGKPANYSEIGKVRLPKCEAKCYKICINILPKAFEFTILGHAAGGGAFSFKNGTTRFGSPHIG